MTDRDIKPANVMAMTDLVEASRLLESAAKLISMAGKRTKAHVESRLSYLADLNPTREIEFLLEELTSASLQLAEHREAALELHGEVKLLLSDIEREDWSDAAERSSRIDDKVSDLACDLVAIEDQRSDAKKRIVRLAANLSIAAKRVSLTRP